jgi:hypothetical protein
LDDNRDIAPPTETTYHVACYITRNTTPTRTLANYDFMTSFTLPANTNSFLDNSHYQVIKTQARRKILTKEPLQSLILDGLSIQLHVPRVYYEIQGGDKHEIPLPLSPEAMARIPEPKYHTHSNKTTFVLLSIYFVMTIDYFHLIHKTVKKRIQHLQQHPHQTHPIDRILSQFKTTGINRQTQTTQEEEDNTNNNSTSTNNSSNTESTTNPAQPQTQRSILNERKRVERHTNPIQTKRKRIEFSTTPQHTRTPSTHVNKAKTSVFTRLGRRPRSPDDFTRIRPEDGKKHRRH